MRAAAQAVTRDALPPVLVAAWHDAPYAIAVVDADLRARWVNPAFAMLTGISHSDHVGRTLADLLPTAHPSLEDRARESLQRGAPISGVRVDAAAGGVTTRRLRATIHPVRSNEGALLGACVMCADVTDETRLVEELWQTQKQLAASQLANVFAHDFNNLLVVIQGYCDLLVMKASDETLKDRLGRIRSAAEAAAGLSRQLLALSRRSTGAASAVDLNLLLRTMRTAVERALPPNIKKAFVFDEQLGLVLAEPGQLEQVVMTLVLQAIGAMASGGTLTVETANAIVGEPDVWQGRLVPGEYVRLSVGDTGSGLNASALAALFEPDDDLPSLVNGPRLGMLAARSLVRAVHGELQATSVAERGTTYTVWWPRHAEAKPDSAITVPQTMRPLPGVRALTALFVEPDALVRDAISAGLAEYGFHVLVASTGAEARAIAASPPATVDVLIANAALADGDGESLAVAITRQLPGTRALIVTSGEGGAPHAARSDSAVWPSLAKPYDLPALVRSMYATLYPATTETTQ